MLFKILNRLGDFLARIWIQVARNQGPDTKQRNHRTDPFKYAANDQEPEHIQTDADENRNDAVSAVIQWLLFAFLKNLEQLFQFLFVLQVLGYFDNGVSLSFGIEVKPNKGGDGDADARQNPEKG